MSSSRWRGPKLSGRHMTSTPALPNFDDVKQAQARIAPLVHVTPIHSSAQLSALAGCELFFKCENLQKTGAFKARGACNAIFSLARQQLRNGVITHSSGNHAMALSYAAAQCRTKATVIMPSDSLKSKKDSVKSYGGELIECTPTLDARESTMQAIQAKTKATFVHPYNDPLVIAGQATCAAEFHEQVPELDILVTPVGGGGITSGSCISTMALSPDTRIIAAEPKAADDAYQSFQAGKLIELPSPTTVADGLKTNLGSLTWPCIRDNVSDIVTVEEQEIVNATRLIWQRLKMVVEPSSAVVLAAVLKYPEAFKNQRVGLILTGGNVDIDQLPW